MSPSCTEIHDKTFKTEQLRYDQIKGELSQPKIEKFWKVLRKSCPKVIAQCIGLLCRATATELCHFISQFMITYIFILCLIMLNEASVWCMSPFETHVLVSFVKRRTFDVICHVGPAIILPYLCVWSITSRLTFFFFVPRHQHAEHRFPPPSGSTVDIL